MNSIILHCKIDEFICKIYEFICKNRWIHLEKSMNSSTKMFEFIYSMNSFVNEFINFEKKLKPWYRIQTLFPTLAHALPHHQQLAEHYCFLILYCFYIWFSYVRKWCHKLLQMNSFKFLFEATKETHEQRKTKIAYRRIQKQDNLHHPRNFLNHCSKQLIHTKKSQGESHDHNMIMIITWSWHYSSPTISGPLTIKFVYIFADLLLGFVHKFAHISLRLLPFSTFL